MEENKNNPKGKGLVLNEEYKAVFNFSENGKNSSSFRPLITLDSIGAKVNAITPGELFWQYAKAGFLYPNKKRKLTPYIELVEENWRKALMLGEEIFWIATVSNQKSKSWASICNWRTNLTGWVSQHLVSSGNAAYSLMLMLGTQVKFKKEASSKPYGSLQNWYRPTNKYAQKVFGFLAESVRKDAVDLEQFQYYMADRKVISTLFSEDIHVLKCSNKIQNGIVEFLRSKRGEIYLSAEELLSGDIELLSLNEIYQKVGLERKRYFWIAYEKANPMPCGVAIVYRAPVGLNFSMIENRCEIIVEDSLSETGALNVCRALLKAACEKYNDFPAPFMPLTSDLKLVPFLAKLGIHPVRSYNQFIWKENGFDDWYNSLWDLSEHSIQRWMRMHQG